MIPADITKKLQGTLGLSGGGRPTVEVYYNAENPLKRQYVQRHDQVQLAEANQAISGEVCARPPRLHQRDRRGREVRAAPVGDVDILGLRRANAIIEAALATAPGGRARARGARAGRAVRRSSPPTTSTSPRRSSPRSARPIERQEHDRRGESPRSSAFASPIAVTVSMMFVDPAAGRRHARARARGERVRAPGSRPGLAARRWWPRRSAWRGWRAFVLTTVMLVVLALFVDLDCGRAPLWLVCARARRGRVRGDGRRRRRRRARGPRGLAARVHGVAADGRARARPVRRGRGRRLRRNRRHLGACSRSSRRSGARRGASTAASCRRRCCTWRR